MNFKFVTIFVIISFLSISVYSQDKVYFDENWNVTDKENASYYRLVVNTKSEKEWIIDYYISGKKAQEAKYINGKPEGKFSVYYDSGELKVEGIYEKGLKVGVWKTYYKNGKIKEKGKYDNDEKVGVWKMFYKND